MRKFLKKSASAIMIVFVLSGGILMESETSFAQSNEVQVLQDQIRSLRQSIKDLQLKVFKGVTPENLDLVMERPGGDQVKVQMAQLKSQILAFEETIRDLNGQYEVLDNRAQRLETRLDKLIEDIDFRLTSIEDRLGNNTAISQNQTTVPTAQVIQSANINADGNSASVSNIDPGITTQVSTDQAKATQTSSIQAGQVTAVNQQGGQVLGTLTQDQLDNFQAAQAQKSNTQIVLGTNNTQAESVPDQNNQSQTPTSDDATSTSTSNLAQFTTPEEEYKAAYKFLQLRDWTGAELAMQQFLDRYPDHVLSENAMYWLGETYYARKMYSDAMSVFASVYQKDEKGRKAPDSLLKLGMSLSQLGQAEQACVTFEILLSEHKTANPLLIKRAKQQHKLKKCAPIQ